MCSKIMKFGRMLLALLSCVALIGRVACEDTSKHKAYNYLLLELTWPMTHSFWNSSIRTPNHFVVNGLWPMRYDWFPVRGCSEDVDLTVLNDNQTVVEQLARNWPKLRSDDNEKKWQLHWARDGSCVWNTSELNGKENYFRKVLDIYDQLDLDSAVKAIESPPNSDGRMYRPNRFKRDLKKYYKFEYLRTGKPQLNGIVTDILCVRRGGQLYLQNIQVCFDTQLKPMRCPHKPPQYDPYGSVFYGARPSLCRRMFYFPSE